MLLSKILPVDYLLLGVLLATLPSSVVEAVGVPNIDVTFYPSILGAMLIGIGVALVIECFRNPPGFAVLGLYGVIAINLCGAVYLGGGLLLGNVHSPFRKQAFLRGSPSC